jgi:hypothetical protein
MTFDLGTINVGETKNAQFSDIQLKNMLPPGQYVIPIEYVSSYLDTGVIGSSDLRRAGYSSYYGLYQYETIHMAADYPPPSGSFYPFIFVEVVEDATGIDVDGYFYGIYTPNSKNVQFALYVTNREMYTFSSLTYTIHTDGGSPIKRVGVPDNDVTTTLLPIKRSYLYGDWTDTIYFYGDMKQIAPAGTNFVQVDVEATDPHSRSVKFSFDAPIVLSANSPSIELLKYSTEIGPNQTAKVTVYLENVGWGGARNMSVYFRSSSASLLMIDTPVFLGKIVPGQLFNYTFTVKPSNDMQALYGNWGGYVYYEYIDDGGAVRKMFASGSTYVNFIVQPKLPSLQITNVVAPGVSPGAKFDVVVTIANLGGSTAYGVQVIWSDSQALFSIEGTNPSTFSLNDLAPGATTTVTFKVKASKAVLPSATYYVYPYFSYKRVDGYGMTYSEGGSRSFSLHTNPGAVPSQQVVKNEASGYTFDVGYMMLGILIVIAVAVGVSMYKKPAPIARQFEPAVAQPIQNPPPPVK